MPLKRTLTAAGLFLLLALNLAAQAEPATPRPVRELQIVDAHGSLLGPVIDFEGPYPLQYPVVALRVESTYFLATMQTSTTFQIADGTIYYESSDCTGAPYIYVYSVGIGWPWWTTPVGVAGERQVIYLGDTSAAPRHLAVGSFIGQYDDTCSTSDWATCCFIPAVATQMVLGDLYEPPFRLTSVEQPAMLASAVPALDRIPLVGLLVSLVASGLYLLRRP